MPYVVGGDVQSRRSLFRLSILSDAFWGLINFIVLFFQTMFQPELTKKGSGYSSSYSARPRDGPDDHRFPRRRMGGFGRPMGGSGPSPPPMAGGG